MDSATRTIIERELLIAAPIAVTFDALLEHVAPGMARPDGVGMPLTLEAFPGGRWFRDLGDDNGHFWGHVPDGMASTWDAQFERIRQTVATQQD